MKFFIFVFLSLIVSIITTVSGSRLDSYYDGCGINKGCFGVPTGCVTRKSCDLFTTFRPIGGTSYFFQAFAGGLPPVSFKSYVAVGISFDGYMDNSSVIGCFHEGGNATTVEVNSYYTTNRRVEQLQNPKDGLDMSYPAEGGVEDRSIYCEFGRSPILELESIGKSFNLLTDSYHILLAMAYGDQMTSVTLGYHNTRGVSIRTLKLHEFINLDE